MPWYLKLLLNLLFFLLCLLLTQQLERRREPRSVVFLAVALAPDDLVNAKGGYADVLRHAVGRQPVRHIAK
jgi:hypothetical protein